MTDFNPAIIIGGLLMLVIVLAAHNCALALRLEKIESAMQRYLACGGKS